MEWSECWHSWKDARRCEIGRTSVMGSLAGTLCRERPLTDVWDRIETTDVEYRWKGVDGRPDEQDAHCTAQHRGVWLVSAI